MRGRGHAERSQARRKVADVTAHDRPEIGIHHCGGEALELAKFRRDLVARANKDAGQFLLDNALCLSLVLRPHEAIEETDCNCAGIGRSQLLGRLAHCAQIERCFDLAVMAHALGDLEAQIARHQGERLVREKIVEIRPLLPPDFEEVSKSFGRQKRRGYAAMLDERIGRNGGAMAEIGDASGRRYVHVGGDAAHSLLDGIRNAARRIIGRGGYFPDFKSALVLFKETNVRERSARVYPHTPARHCCCLHGTRWINPSQKYLKFQPCPTCSS